MRAMILAAGLGTRLGELSDERPKPLLPVCNWPLVRWAAAWCVHHGIDELAVNLHHLGEMIGESLGDGSALGARIHYSVEREILGTGGGVRAMAALLPRETCVVVNGKIISDIDLSNVLELHRARGALATMVLYPTEDAERWGAIGIDADQRVVRLIDRRRQGRGPVVDHMFTGVHVLEPELIDRIPDGPDGPPMSCIIRTAYRELFDEGATICGYVHRGYFQEHSTPARYLEGNFNLLEGRVLPPARPPQITGIHETAAVAASARFDGPVLVGARAVIAAGTAIGPRVVIGEGARVQAGATLEDCVVWPGAVVSSGMHRRCIFTANQRVQVPR